MSEERPTHCRHYSYKPGDGPQCAVNALHADGTVVRCMPVPKRDACPKREEYTTEEKAKQQADLFGSAENVLKVLAAIPKGSASGMIPCPKCGAGLRYSNPSPRAIRVACSTENCIRFMS